MRKEKFILYFFLVMVGVTACAKTTLDDQFIKGFLGIMNGEPVRLYEEQASGQNYVGLKSPASLTTDTTFTLPDGDGSNGQVVVTDGSGTLAWGTPSGGGSKNYFSTLNSNVESTVGEWVTDDGAGSASAVISLSHTTSGSEKLAGEGSLKLTKSASDGSGHFMELALETIDLTDRGFPLYGSFAFYPGSGYESGDLILEVYNPLTTDTLYMGPASEIEIPNTNGRFNFVVYTEAINSTLEFRIKVNNTDTNSYTASFDEFKIGPASQVTSPIVSAWQTYTPAVESLDVGIGTIDIEGQYRRVGDSVEIQATIKVTAATTDTTAVAIYMPTGLTADAGKIALVQTLTGLSVTTSYNIAGSTGFDTIAGTFVPGSNRLQFLEEGTGSYLIGTDFTLNDELTVRAVIPIEGWSVGAVVNDNELSLQTVKVRAEGNAGTSITALTTDVDFIEVSDSHGTWDGTTFTAPRSGNYRSTGQIFINANAFQIVNAYIDGTRDRECGYNATSTTVHNFNWEGYLEKGAELTFRTNVTATLSNTGYRHWINISSVPDFTVLGAVRNNEYKSSTSGIVSFPITAGQYGDLTSIELDAGEWDIEAHIVFYSNGATSATSCYIGVSSTSGNSSTGLGEGDNMIYITKRNTSTIYDPITLSRYRVQPTDTTTYYLKSRVNGSISNMEAGYKITARRVK